MAELLPFQLYPFDENDSEHLALKEHVEQGNLPGDTLFRLAGIGLNVVDPQDGRKGLQYMLLRDIIEHADNWSHLRTESRTILENDRPNAIVDVEGGQYAAYRQLTPMYYTMGNLARAIKASRADRGMTIVSPPPGFLWAELGECEARICAGLARPLWRTIINRFHPEWLENPDLYYPNRTLSFFTTYELSAKTIRRRMIGHAVISDSVILDIYNEAETVGVKGIGPQGRESLRRLLEDEHLELSRDVLATPAD